MNIKLIAFIDGLEVELDLGEKTPNVLHTYMVSERNNWESLATVETLNTTIELPITQTNARVFDNYTNLTSTGSPLDPKKAILTYGGTYVLEGVLVLVNGSGFIGEFGKTIDAVGGGYTVVFKSMRGRWGAEIQNLKFADLGAYLDSENREINITNVTNGLNASYPTDKAGFFFQKYSNVWQAKTGANGTKYPDLWEATGFIFAASLLDAIAQRVRVRFDSEFFQTDFFRSLIIPLPLTPKYEGAFSFDYLIADVKQTAASVPPTFTSTIIFDQQNQQPTIGANPYNPTTGVYTAPFKGFYLIEASFEWVVPTGGNLIGAVVLRLNGVNQTDALPQVNFSGVTVGEVYTATHSRVWALNKNDTVEFRGFNQLGLVNQVASNSTMRITGEAINEYGKADQLFAPKYLLRDWSARDFMLGLKQLFNLVFETSRDGRTVRVEPESAYVIRDRTTEANIPMQGFYKVSSFVTGYQLSDRDLDRSKRVRIDPEPEQPTTFLYAYAVDEQDDYMRVGQNQNTPIPRYSAQYRKGAVLLNNETQNRTNAFFSGTVHLFDVGATDAQPNYAPAVQIPLSLPVANTPASDLFAFAPRILQFVPSGLSKPTDGLLKYTTLNNVANLAIIPHAPAYMVNFNDRTGFEMCLSYSDTLVQGRLTKGLLSDFYAEKLSYSLNTKLVTAFFYIKNSVIAGLTFANKIELSGALCRIVQISNYNPLSDVSSTQVTLLPETVEKFNGLTNSEISPIVS